MTSSLRLHRHFSRPKAPLLLIIMDGVGLGRESEENAFYMAKTPHLDGLLGGEVFTPLHAHGTYMGLPSDSDMGNSEIGHNVMGAGRVFDQGAKLVNQAFDAGVVFEQPIWREITERALSGACVHFVGLYSDANVHSNIEHLYAMLEKLRLQGGKLARVHALLDGRDVGQKTALMYTDPAEQRFASLREGGLDVRFASGGGRMNVTMDRYEADWRIVERGWNAHVHGRARNFHSMREAVETFYAEGKTDQYFDAFALVDDQGAPLGPVRDGDAVVFFNFRGDRAMELSRAFDAGPEFDKFDRGRVPDVLYAGMMQYDGDLKVPRRYLVTPPSISGTASELLCLEKTRSYAAAETQKFGHVTYFWNGNRSGKFSEELECYREVPSDRVPFDQKPEMKAREITAAALEALDSGTHDFLRLNFANGDMVGHTGNYEAAIVAMEVVDECVGRLLAKVRSLGGTAVVTADHGNVDEMFTIEKGQRVPKTSHTLSPVPLAIQPAPELPPLKIHQAEGVCLGHLAATLLYLMGYETPAGYLPGLVERK